MTFRIVGKGTDYPQQFSDTYQVEVDGKQYVYEQWMARNVSGDDWRDENDESVVAPFETEEDEEAWEEAFQAAQDRWAAAYGKYVQPALERAEQEAFGESEAVR